MVAVSLTESFAYTGGHLAAPQSMAMQSGGMLGYAPQQANNRSARHLQPQEREVDRRHSGWTPFGKRLASKCLHARTSARR